MKAATLAKTPTKDLQDIIAEVQDAANLTQSEAWHLHPAEDGSVVEIRCAPEPKYRGELPDISEDNDGFLAEKDGKLFKATAKVVEHGKDAQKLLAKHRGGDKYRTLYQLLPKSEPKFAEDGTLVTEGPRPDDASGDFAIVEFDWVEVDPQWKEHAVKKSADVRLKAHTSLRAASNAVL